MKLKRLLGRVEAFLSAKQRERRARRGEIHDILKKLKKKERKLRQETAQESNEDLRLALEAKCRVVHAQRTKGVEALKTLRKEKRKA